MAKDTGWIRLYRSSFNNRLYFSEPFTRWQAWVDLLLLANHNSGMFRVRGIKVEVLRGQTGFSAVELAERWKWSRGKVNRYLNELKDEHQIVQQKNNVTTLISIVNYEKYQTDGTENDTLVGTQVGHQTDTKRTPNGQQTFVTDVNINELEASKNDKKNKNDNNVKKEEYILWESEKKSFFNSGDWIFKFCTDKGIAINDFDKAAKEFISDIELKEDFKEVKELKRHFTNWYNLNHKNGKSVNSGGKSTKSGTSIARVEALKKW